MLLDDHGFLLLAMIDITAAILPKKGMAVGSGSLRLLSERELLVQLDVCTVLCTWLTRRRLILRIAVSILLFSLEMGVCPLMPEHLICLVLIQKQILVGVDTGQFIDEGWLR